MNNKVKLPQALECSISTDLVPMNEKIKLPQLETL